MDDGFHAGRGRDRGWRPRVDEPKRRRVPGARVPLEHRRAREALGHLRDTGGEAGLEHDRHSGRLAHRCGGFRRWRHLPLGHQDRRGRMDQSLGRRWGNGVGRLERRPLLGDRSAGEHRPPSLGCPVRNPAGQATDRPGAITGHGGHESRREHRRCRGQRGHGPALGRHEWDGRSEVPSPAHRRRRPSPLRSRRMAGASSWFRIGARGGSGTSIPRTGRRGRARSPGAASPCRSGNKSCRTGHTTQRAVPDGSGHRSVSATLPHPPRNAPGAASSTSGRTSRQAEGGWSWLPR